jgi:hypothetical protein
MVRWGRSRLTLPQGTAKPDGKLSWLPPITHLLSAVRFRLASFLPHPAALGR